MKKYLALALALVITLCSGLLTGCGGSKAEYLKDLQADKFVTLGQYIGIEISIPEPEVTVEELDETMASLLINFPMGVSVDGPSEAGDMINIDFVGTIDGVPFPGGSAEGYEYTLGSYQVIADLEEGMHGMRVGDVWDIPVVFPENYHSADLAGQPAVFLVTLNSIERPVTMTEMTDEYADWFTGGIYNTVDDLREFMRFNMLSEVISSRNNEITGRIHEAVIDNSEFKKLPEAMVQRINDAITNNLAYYASMYNMDVETYMMLAGLSDGTESIEDALWRQAEQTTKLYLAYQAIADREGLNPTDEELEAGIAQLAEDAGMPLEAYKLGMDINSYREFRMYDRVNTFLIDNAIIISE